MSDCSSCFCVDDLCFGCAKVTASNFSYGFGYCLCGSGPMSVISNVAVAKATWNHHAHAETGKVGAP